MVLNIACAILIALLALYVTLSVITIVHYIFFKNARIIELFFISSFIAVCIVVIIMIFFIMFPTLNIEFKI
jgi:hypothetical protein